MAMRRDIGFGLKVGGVLAATLFGFAPIQSIRAQPAKAGGASGEIQEITVTAPEIVRKPVATGRGPLVEVVSISRGVNYADLDLTTASGQSTLKSRIHSTAVAACKQLDDETRGRVYPPTGATGCERDAAADALKVADRVIAAANAR
jgi:UrcA family protein